MGGFLIEIILRMGKRLYTAANLATPSVENETLLVPHTLEKWTNHIKHPLLNTVKDWLNACQNDTDLEALVKGLLSKAGKEADFLTVNNKQLIALTLPSGLGTLWHLFTRDPDAIKNAMGTHIVDTKKIDEILAFARQVLKEISQDIERNLRPQKYLSLEDEFNMLYTILHQRFPSMLSKEPPAIDAIDVTCRSINAAQAVVNSRNVGNFQRSSSCP